MSEHKPFIHNPRWTSLRNSVFSFIVGLISFGLIMLGSYLEGAFLALALVGLVIFVIAFISTVFFWLKHFWIMFVKGGYRDEYEEHLESLKPKQPWEK